MRVENYDAQSTLVNGGNYWVVNWKIVEACKGLDEAVILAYLCSKQSYWLKKGGLDNEGMFYCTIPQMSEETTIESRRQKKAIDMLKKYGLVTVKNKGIPYKRYFRVEVNKLKAQLDYFKG